MFGIRKKNDEPDEAQRFLDAVQDEPDQPDPHEQDDLALTGISVKDSKAHCDIVNIIVLSFVMLFFGTGFLTLTSYQDFSDDEPFSIKALVSGKFFSHIEKNFNGSLPLHDFFHNANEFASFCFGLGNTPDYISMSGLSDDTYNIVDENGFVPIVDSRPDGIGEDDPMQTFYNRDEDGIFSQSEDNGKHKKISGIVMATTASASSSSSGETTTTNNREPGATTTTTVPPETTTTTAEPTTTDEPPPPTEPPVSEPDESSDEPPEIPEAE